MRRVVTYGSTPESPSHMLGDPDWLRWPSGVVRWLVNETTNFVQGSVNLGSDGHGLLVKRYCRNLLIHLPRTLKSSVIRSAPLGVYLRLILSTRDLSRVGYWR